jgi:hypothetical protein
MTADPNAVALALQCRAVGLPEPALEYRFHATRKWRFDLAWPSCKLAVEINGGVWTSGRHQTPTGYQGDMEKMTEAALLGWRVVQVPPAKVQDGTALGLIERAFGRERE